MRPRAKAILLPLVLCAACMQNQSGGTANPVPLPCEPRGAYGCPSEEPGHTDFALDGVSRRWSAIERLPQDAKIRVLVTNANPFLYEYRIRANAQEIQQASIADLYKVGLGITLPTTPLRDAGGISGDAILGTKSFFHGIRDDAGAGRRERPRDRTCTSAATAANEQLDGRYIIARRSREEIAVIFKDFTDFAHEQDSAFSVHRKVYLDPTKNGTAVQAAAAKADEVLAVFAQSIGRVGDVLNQRVTAFRNEVKDLTIAARTDLLTHSACETLVGTAAGIHALVPDTSLFLANLASVEAKAKQITNARSNLSPLVNDDRRYYAAELLRQMERPSWVTVSVSRRAAASTDSFLAVGTQRIRVGGDARYSLSAGFAWTSLQRQSFEISRQFVTPPPGSPNDTIIATVVQTERSSWRVFPAVAFNTKFKTGWPQVYVGVGVSNVSTDPRPGILAGTAFEVQKDFLLMVGGFAGSEDHLGEGLRPGDRVPGSLAKPPIQSRWRVGLNLGLTYRLF